MSHWITAIVIAILVTMLAVPVSAERPAMLDDVHYTCTITGAKAPGFARWSGFAASVPDAQSRCQRYADKTAGGSCGDCRANGTAAASWTCTGPVNNCTGHDDEKTYSGSCPSVTGKGRTEARARRDALDECQAELDNATPGKWWSCSDSSALTCTK